MLRASSSSRTVVLILLCGIFGTTMFFIGRFSVSRNDKKISTAPISDAAANKKTSSIQVIVASEEKSATTNFDCHNDWNKLFAQPRTPDSVAALSAMLEKLAASDPTQAMSLAQSEENLLLKDKFVQAALRGWGRFSATNAANWALALPNSNARETAIASIFAGAVAANPDEAVRAGKFIIQNNPDEATGYGARLVDALCDAGNFEVAAKMSASGDDNQRAVWMAEAFCKWAQLQPDEAAQAATAMSDPNLKSQALQGIVGGWAAADPAGLVQFVTQLPQDDAQRGELLSQALNRWARTNPEAAAAWINDNPAGPASDQGVAAIATMEGIKPELGVNWADSITDAKLRSETLNLVIRNWVTVDAVAAKKFFDDATGLLPEDRAQLVEIFGTSNSASAQQ